MDHIGVVDTMFARYDMGAEAVDELKQCPGFGERFDVIRRTVPGFKDLGVACKKLIEQDGCAIVVALGMPGKAAIDQVCAHEASQGIMLAQLLTTTHVLEVFVHENEEQDPARLAAVCVDRARKHRATRDWMLYEPEQLTPARRAGCASGLRRRRAHRGAAVLISPSRGRSPRPASAHLAAGGSAPSPSRAPPRATARAPRARA